LAPACLQPPALFVAASFPKPAFPQKEARSGFISCSGFFLHAFCLLRELAEVILRQ
jgi:hypothetical protein